MRLYLIALYVLMFIALSLHADLAFCGENDIKTRAFANFNVELPPGWDGDEQKGFVSDNANEYLLTLGKKDESGDRYLAQISVFLLPNAPGVNGREAAKILAKDQGESSEPVEKEGMWVFTGEPRSNVVKGMAMTYVNTTPEMMLIIIAQDPDEKEAAAIVGSLKGETPVARKLLGR